MLLLAASTNVELDPLLDILGEPEGICYLTTGVGCLETALSLSRFLSSKKGDFVDKVINFGVAGSFANSGAKILDICLAESERLADFGICFKDSIEMFDSLDVPHFWQVDPPLFSQTENLLKLLNVPVHKGPFITVNGVSATDERADFFWNRYRPLCENMEGGAVMRVCQKFSLPCIEIRCVSNFVEKRDSSTWKLEEAALKCAQVTAQLTQELLSKP